MACLCGKFVEARVGIAKAKYFHQNEYNLIFTKYYGLSNQRM